jgi:hypothetical protein
VDEHPRLQFSNLTQNPAMSRTGNDLIGKTGIALCAKLHSWISGKIENSGQNNSAGISRLCPAKIARLPICKFAISHPLTLNST